MRRGETEADMQLVAKFIAAAAVLQQDPAALASEITRSRSLELILNQVLLCAVLWDLLLVSALTLPH
jgi:hypothetical protein